MKRLLLATVALAAMVATATAGTIALQIQEDAGAPQQFLGAPASTFSSAGVQFGDFLISNITGSTVGSTQAPVLLSSNTLTIQNQTNDPHILNIWVTGNGITSPTGLTDVFSSFTNVVLSDGWTARLESLFSATDQMFTGSVIDSQLFLGTALPTGQAGTFNTPIDLGAGPYSLTAHFTFVSDGFGQSNSAITIAAVPGPIVGAGLPGILALISMGGLYWKRRKAIAS
jgi:hypothetical protein